MNTPTLSAGAGSRDAAGSPQAVTKAAAPTAAIAAAARRPRVFQPDDRPG